MRAAPIAAVSILALVRHASADDVTSAINDLHTSASWKVRVSASMQLARIGDARGIAALAAAVLHDPDADVRSAAAIGLAKIVTSASSAADQLLALGALDSASRLDSDSHVRHLAQRSHDKLLAIIAPKAGTYVEVARVSGNAPARIATHSSRTIGKLVDKQTGFQTTTPGTGYEVDAKITSLTASASGGVIDVACALDIVLEDHPATRVIATLSSRATVVAASRADVPAAGKDCVDALSENLMNKVFALLAQPTTVTVTARSGASSTSGSAQGRN